MTDRAATAPRDADPDPVERLVLECIDRFESGGPTALEEILARAGEHAPRVRARVETLRRMGLLSTGFAAEPEKPPERLGEFRLLERIGGGGMGVVYLAEQTTLGRRVALKLIRPEHMYFGGARERFQREAEAIARLAHPSIVPIHSFGEEGGIPYFAMEHVAGATMADVVRALSDAAPEKLTGADLERAVRARAGSAPPGTAVARIFARGWIDAIVEIARHVALALEHAHQRGVLHRDVKLSNVMVTPDGRVLLIDFGLAWREGASGLTRTGALLGSLAYMSPEQVEGDSKRIGAPTDVYGLGVALYEMATLRAPFADGASTKLCLEILAGSKPRPRLLNPAIPPDLETVCLAAMDVDPDRRYPSAAAFARDLAHVQEQRPIEARRPSPFVHVLRWVQRHPASTAALVLAVVLFVGGPIVYGVFQRNARERLETANLETRRANDELSRTIQLVRAAQTRAESNFREALGAVSLLTDVGERQLADVPQAEVARRELLEAALAFQTRLAAQRGDDPSVLLETGLARLRVGGIQKLLGRAAESVEALRGSFEDFEAWRAATQAAFPPLDAARAADALGEQYSHLARPEEARVWLERALAIATEEGRPDRRSRSARYLTHEIHFDLSSACRLAGETPRALEHLRRCREILGELVREDPADSRFAGALAETITAQSEWLNQGLTDLSASAAAPPALANVRDGLDGAIAGAFDDLRGALAVLEANRSARPAGAEIEAVLAWARASLGIALVGGGRLAEAEAELRPALAALEKLARDFPRTLDYRNKLVTCTSSLAQALVQTGRSADGRALFERALAEQEKLADEFFGTPGLLLTLGTARMNMAVLDREFGDPEAVCRLAASAVEALDLHLARNPRDEYARPSRDYCSLILADAFVTRRMRIEAESWLRQMESSTAAGDLVYAAKLYARCAVLARDDRDLADEERARIASRCTAGTLAFLRRAVELGFADPTELEPAADLDPLRETPEFQALLEAVRKR